MQRKPTLLRAETDGHNATLTLKIDRELEDFKGHFPTFPLLPGVTQIDLAVRYAMEYLPTEGVFGGMEVIKFQDPILPDSIITLTLKWDEEKHKLYFSYQSGDRAHSSGRILISEAA
ncbi:3-hydroxyacyl-ACP dehydratase [Parasalinivibrio latis]|uniref:ApeI family dehydratase n=1 Tax=Parasalinivibrio latis TaxID=2952610 RepID=UPI0030E22513